jgi:ABC-type branched-subunit amino acid transport system ATPase component
VAQVIFGVFLVAVVLWRPKGLLPEHARSASVRDAKALEGRGDKEISFGHTSTNPGVVAALHGSPMLSVENVSKSYGGLTAVRDAKISVASGEIVGIVGPNGAGKTTLFDIVGGAVPPDVGEIRLNGKAISRLKPFMLARQGIGRLFQQVRPFADMTVLEKELVAFPGVARENPLLAWLPIDRKAEGRRRNEARELLRYVGLDGYATESAGSLSFGQQKLIGFARLLAQGASVWLLDEPAAGIDPHMRLDIRRTISKVRLERGVTMLIVEHNMDFLEHLVDRVVFMAEGQVVRTASFEEIMKDEELNRLYLGG